MVEVQMHELQTYIARCFHEQQPNKRFFRVFKKNKTDSKVGSVPLVGRIPRWIDWSYAINCFA